MAVPGEKDAIHTICLLLLCCLAPEPGGNASFNMLRKPSYGQSSGNDMRHKELDPAVRAGLHVQYISGYASCNQVCVRNTHGSMKVMVYRRRNLLFQCGCSKAILTMYCRHIDTRCFRQEWSSFSRPWGHHVVMSYTIPLSSRQAMPRCSRSPHIGT